MRPLLFPAPEFIGLLMYLNVTKTGFCHLSDIWQLRATLCRDPSQRSKLSCTRGRIWLSR